MMMVLVKLVQWNERSCICRKSMLCDLNGYNTTTAGAYEIQPEEEENKFETF